MTAEARSSSLSAMGWRPDFAAADRCGPHAWRRLPRSAELLPPGTSAVARPRRQSGGRCADAYPAVEERDAFLSRRSGCAGVFVTTESWLNAKAEPSARGRVFSVYMVGTFVALAIGQLLLASTRFPRCASRSAAGFATRMYPWLLVACPIRCELFATLWCCSRLSQRTARTWTATTSVTSMPGSQVFGAISSSSRQELRRPYLFGLSRAGRKPRPPPS